MYLQWLAWWDVWRHCVPLLVWSFYLSKCSVFNISGFFIFNYLRGRNPETAPALHYFPPHAWNGQAGLAGREASARLQCRSPTLKSLLYVISAHCFIFQNRISLAVNQRENCIVEIVCLKVLFIYLNERQLRRGGESERENILFCWSPTKTRSPGFQRGFHQRLDPSSGTFLRWQGARLEEEQLGVDLELWR